MVIEVVPDRSKLYVSVVSTIEAQILSGELPVGARLPSEAEIARTFNISTRSVREGMQILETKGLIRRRHGERAEVVRDDINQFLGSLASTVQTLFAKDTDYLVQLMDVRRMFELEVVERLANGEGAISGEVQRALDGMQDSVAAKDFNQFTQSDADFHRGLVHSLGNEILSTVYGNLYALITEVIRVTSRVPRKTLADGLAEHEAILAKILSGDAEGSRASMREHIDNSTAYLEQAISGSKRSNERL